MKFIDDKSKKNLKWWNRNYFFVGTIILASLQIILFACLGSGWSNKLFDFKAWYGTFSIQNFFNGIFGSIDHTNWQHVLSNMLCFAVAGSYLERKMGTLKFIPFILVMCIFSRMANMLVLQFTDFFFWGFSSCNYALYAFIILDVIFNCKKLKESKLEIAYSVVILGLIYLACCFNGGTQRFSFTYYPYDFIYNSWHWSGFLVGIIIFFLLFFQKFFTLKEAKCKDVQVEEKAVQPKEEVPAPVQIEEKGSQKIEETVETVASLEEVQSENIVEENFEEIVKQNFEDLPKEEKSVEKVVEVEPKNVQEQLKQMIQTVDKVAQEKPAAVEEVKTEEPKVLSSKDLLLRRMKKDAEENS